MPVSPPPLFPPEEGEGEGAGADELLGEAWGEALDDGDGDGDDLGEDATFAGGATFAGIVDAALLGDGGAATDVDDAGSAVEEDWSSSQAGSPKGWTVEVGSALAAEDDALADGVQYGLRLSFKFSSYTRNRL